MNMTARRILPWVIALFIPFILLLLAIRLLFSPLFVPIEYRMPGFPPDLYGFTTEERIHWAGVSLDYLYNDAGIEFLADQRLSDGSPLYNERELKHMEDVKILFQQMNIVRTILLIALLAIGIWCWRLLALETFVRGLGQGGRLTIILILSILVFVAISFRQLFTIFHQIFFEGDTWLFNYSDTLIRLFPMRLWQDAFIGVGIVTILGAVLLILLERAMRARFKQV
jgi:integral membrane protein (TIGR01906 family)